MIFTDILIALILIYAAFIGKRRGAVLAGLELASFTAATVAAVVLYRPAGSLLQHITGAPLPLGKITAFVIIWLFTEIVFALLVRFLVLPRLGARRTLRRADPFLGASANFAKTLILIWLLINMYASLPVSQNAKTLITKSLVARAILGIAPEIRQNIFYDLEGDLSFYTVTADPESEERVWLSFKTTGLVDEGAEDEMAALINKERIKVGLGPLSFNNTARSVAREYAKDMFARGYFSHLNIEGKTPFDRMRAGGVKFGTAGENLALAPTVSQAHAGLMNSPGHRANIISPNYKTVGLGIVNGGPHGIMVVQNFTD